MIKLAAALILVAGQILLGCVGTQADTSAVPVSIQPNNPALVYIGRWDTSDPISYHSYWGGAYLRTNFTGTSVSIETKTPTRLVVSVDGEFPRELDIDAGVAPLTLKPLKAGNHSLLVGSDGQNYEVLFGGLVLDSGATVSAPPIKPIIEYIGDSITAGDGPEDQTTVNYAWNTAEALDCDHTQIAFSDRALTTGYGCASDKTGLDQQYFRMMDFNHSETTPWNMSTYTPAIVVVNLGQNDQCGSEPPAVLGASLQSFLLKIRADYPNAKIVVLRPFSGAFGSVEQDTVRQLMFDGDQRMLFVDTSTWLTLADFRDGIHPNGLGNLKIFSRLAPILRALLSSP